LSNRSEKPEKGINKLSFSKYYELPWLINVRLFSLLDLDENNYLDSEEFVNGMCNLFSGNYLKLTRIVFEIYDFDKDGEITREDIRIVFSYLPLNSKRQNKFSDSL
jgi:Ca2+-binding EF-hand superfamily protein